MDDQYVFSCSECRAEFRVDRTVRQDLRRIGCLRCEAPVSDEDFSPAHPHAGSGGSRARTGR